MGKSFLIYIRIDGFILQVKFFIDIEKKPYYLLKCIFIMMASSMLLLSIVDSNYLTVCHNLGRINEPKYSFDRHYMILMHLELF